MANTDDLVQAFLEVANDIFTQRVRDGKINPAHEAANIAEFETQFMDQYRGDDHIKHTTLRNALRWLENYIDTAVDLMNPDSVKNIKYITAIPTQNSIDGEIQAIAEPLVFNETGLKPEVPVNPNLKPNMEGFDYGKHILKGQLVLNEVDNLWYYRKGDSIIELKVGLELAFEHVIGLGEWSDSINLSISEIIAELDLLENAISTPKVSFKQYFALSSQIDINYLNDVNKIRFGTGLLTHFGLQGGIRQWAIAQNIQTLTSQSSLYYIYAKCSKTNNTGNVIADLNILEDTETDYHFLVGSLTPVINGARSLALTSGIPSFNAEQIKVGRIVSSDGSSYFDLNTGVFVGKFTLMSGSSGIENILTVGGRNLIRNSSFKLGLPYWNSQGNHSRILDNVTLYNGLKTLKITSLGVGDGSNDVNTSAIAITQGKEYILSFWAKANSDINITASLIGANYTSSSVFAITSTWKRYVLRMISGSGNTLSFKLAGAGIVNLMNVKLEEGNVTTDWSAANEDLDTSIEDLKIYVDSAVLNLQTQVDNQVMSWFYNYDPSLINEPLTLWTSDTDKNKHLGDLFYNSVSGNSWRFNKTVAGVYEWAVNNSTDISAALSAAAQAQDTADGKRRVFTSIPTTGDEYDSGDLWANASFGIYTNELLQCTTHKDAGIAFNIDHWKKATKYTDDTVAIDAKAVANAKSRSFSGINGDIPNIDPPNYKVGDTWQDGTDLRICTSITGNLTTDFVKRTIYDSTIITMSNGVVTAGSLRVKDGNNGEWGGLRGATGTDGNEIGLWLGATMANRTSAPFRVSHNGSLFAVQGNIAGWTIGIQGLYRDGTNGADSCGLIPSDWPFYAGSTLSGRGSAPFRVSKDGAFYASSGKVGGWDITSSGIYKDAGETGCGLWSLNLANISVCLYAGAKNENRFTAPFRVSFDGSVYMAKATIDNAIINASQFKSALSGERVTININNDAAIRIYDPEGGSAIMQARHGGVIGPNFIAEKNGAYCELSYKSISMYTYELVNGPHLKIYPDVNNTLAVFMKRLPNVGSLMGLKLIYQDTATGQLYVQK